MRIIRFFTAVCGVVVAFAACPAWASSLNSAPLDFELAGEAGFVRLSKLAAQITVVNFWRADCPPCLREMPRLAKLARSGQARVITVAVQRPSETLSAPDIVRKSLRSPLLSLHAPTESRGLLSRFGNPKQGLPHTVVLNAQRVLCARKTGEVDTVWLNTALKQCAAPTSS